jgi:Holliday junction resolvasome RuvABC DNA-binding subunit
LKQRSLTDRQKIVADPMQISTYRSRIVAILVSLALAGCDRNQSQTSQQSTINQTPEGHSETKTLRAASAVGYDGKQLQKQVDEVLEQKKKRNRDLEKALDDTGPQ